LLNQQAEVCMALSKKLQDLKVEFQATELEIVALSKKIKFINTIKKDEVNVSNL